jgi:hypothetical protein
MSIFAWTTMQAQDIDLPGTWTMYEMTWSNNQDVNTTTEDQMKDQGMMTDYFIMPDGSFKLVSNMTGSGQMETVEGTWKLEGDKLTFALKLGNNITDIIWDFSYEGEVFHLTRTSPDGSISVVNSFKKKEAE